MPKRGSELLIAHLLPQNIPTHLLAHSLAKTSTAGPSMCYLGHARTQTLWYPGGQRCCQHTHHLSLAATPLPLLLYLEGRGLWAPLQEVWVQSYPPRTTAGREEVQGQGVVLGREQSPKSLWAMGCQTSDQGTKAGSTQSSKGSQPL